VKEIPGAGSGPGFEWLVAWRHLRDTSPRSHYTLVTGVSLLVVGILLAFLVNFF